MRKNKLLCLLLAGACISATAQQAAATSESRAAVLFLLIEPGARSIAMGESYVAIADDATASYFNPAALAGQTGKKMNFTHAKWLPGLADDLSYEFLAYSQPVEGWGHIGINGALLNLGEQTRTDEHQANLGTFTSYDFALSVAYGTEIGSNLTAGIGLKYIHSHLAELGTGEEKGKGIGNSFATDLGLLWRITPDLRFGAALRNLGPKIAYIDASQADPLPQHIVLGFAYELMETEYHDMLLSVDVYKPLIDDHTFAKNLITAWADESLSNEFEEIDLHVGGEYRYGLSEVKDQAFLALRAGYSLDRDGDLKLPTFGIGIRYNMMQVDVAYITGDDTPMQDNTRYSLNLSF